MPRFELLQVDAFTTQALAGNPCAVVMDADGLSAEQMQAITREMNLSETAFVLPSDHADFRARYFTPGGEIPMAGHPTIATCFALVDTGRLHLDAPVTTISLELQVGPVPVDLVRDADGGVERIVMTQHAPEFLTTLTPDQVLPVFGLKPEDLLPDLPLQVVSTGTPQLMIPLRDLDALRRARPDLMRLAALHAEAEFFSTHLFALHGVSEAGQTFARHFSSPPDIFEDPFTGSATGGMGAYLWHHGLIESPEFVAEQGHWMLRPGQATVELIGPPAAIAGVKVGGPAVTVMRGELVL
jgi:trans-2,3-dihydro-3-hydroxyanthranilate isomerase